jgi:tRNA U34 5-methylaminomethyl-2-thiouridine-forming methyltransferase MnmC
VSRDGDFELITLRNGNRAVRHLGHGEVMHPSVGPWREANLLYVEQPRLGERLAAGAEEPSTGAEEPSAGESPDVRRAGACPPPGHSHLATPLEPFRIYDVGLGAAANASAALACAVALGQKRRRALEVVSFEVDLAPLRLALADEAGFPFLTDWREAATALMREGRWVGDKLDWRLELGEFLSRLPRAPRPADLVFYDPFSPEKNPSLWTRHALAQVRAACREDGDGALLVTYSASTRTRVSLLMAGFFVGAGDAIGTKKETTIASTRLEALEKPLGADWLGRWTRSTARAPHGEELTRELEQALPQHPQFAVR